MPVLESSLKSVEPTGLVAGSGLGAGHDSSEYSIDLRRPPNLIHLETVKKIVKQV